MLVDTKYGNTNKLGILQGTTHCVDLLECSVIYDLGKIKVSNVKVNYNISAFYGTFFKTISWVLRKLLKIISQGISH
jgi:hypothetical protein